MLYQNQNDETLVMLTLAGEQSAYEVLVSRHHRTVIQSAMKITRSEFMAEDAAQDAFVTAWMKLDTLNEMEKYCAWVCKIARNCALNIVRRMSSFVPMDISEHTNIADESRISPEEQYVASEDERELQTAVKRLSDKVRTVIQMYYFEGLSIVEIADRMRVSQGTVKWQLHEGRKKIRKELCAMNEKWNDTLVERVMKKVEELKLWRLKNSKDGFEIVYNDVLKEVEELPESEKKYHALADVLESGWWWLPGKKSDELFETIKSAAIKGKNDEVMKFIVTREDSQVYDGAKIDFILEKQIPMLKEAGFVKTLAHEWFWLGYEYLKRGIKGKGIEAFNNARALLTPNDANYILAPNVQKMLDRVNTDLKDKQEKRYLISCDVEEYRYIDGEIRRYGETNVGEGYIYSVDRNVIRVFKDSSLCDGRFFADISVGEKYTGSDGTKLKFVSNNEIIHTPAGVFDNCQLWKTETITKNREFTTILTWYKEGVGIVKHSRTKYGYTESCVLKLYSIAGGKGFLPLAKGNKWDYVGEYDENAVVSNISYSVEYCDDSTACLLADRYTERISYNEDLWFDMMQAIKDEYYICDDDKEMLCDTTKYVERAETLAKTPMERAHTKLACSLARRLIKTDRELTPDSDITGHWNFFERSKISTKNGVTCINKDRKWNFEWKSTSELGNAGQPLLYNDVYGILQDATKCLWSDEWRIGAAPTVEYALWDYHNIKTSISCEACEPVSTKAGTFNDCIKLTLDIKGLKDGWEYRGGYKVYYFAKGVGIVRAEHSYCGETRVSVYDLTSYKGEGDGYMPFEDGMERHYEAKDLTDGYEASVDYVYVKDESGDIVVFADKTGIRRILSPVTQYSGIFAETEVDRLWYSGKQKEAHSLHAGNNFKLLTHYICRPSYNRGNAKRSIEIQKFSMGIMEMAGGGTVPDGFTGAYGWISLVRSAAHFGNGEKEMGYYYLETALDSYERWKSFEKGAELSLGNEMIFGGVKVIKGKHCILYPDGKKEPYEHSDDVDVNSGMPYYAMTAEYGWEWFNCVKGEERYKLLVERARNLAK